MTTTPNLGLTQYAGTDTMNFLTQYNADMDKIDTATGDNGWISARATLTYASASAPTFVCNTSTDLTTRISVGMKIKLTQTTTKYFFVTAITSTTITLYGGTDYVLTNTAISNVYYSMVKSPFGFPMNTDKWSITTKITTNILLSVNGTYPNISLIVPIGDWHIYGRITSNVSGGGAGFVGMTISILDQNGVSYDKTLIGGNGITSISENSSFAFNLSIASTPLTFTLSSAKYDANTTSMILTGADSPTILTATCAYL